MTFADQLGNMSYTERLFRAALFLHKTGRVVPVDMLARLQAAGIDIRRFV